MILVQRYKICVEKWKSLRHDGKGSNGTHYFILCLVCSSGAFWSQNVLTEKFVKELHLTLKNGTSDSRLEWFVVGDKFTYKELHSSCNWVDISYRLGNQIC